LKPLEQLANRTAVLDFPLLLAAAPLKLYDLDSYSDILDPIFRCF